MYFLILIVLWVHVIDAICKTHIIVAAFGFGNAAICNSDYLEVYNAYPNRGSTTPTASRSLITRFCGNVSDNKGKFLTGSSVVKKMRVEHNVE